jgi:aldehyde dehydrogenase (NAD(P)+)
MPPVAPAASIEATVPLLRRAAATLPGRSQAELAELARACCGSLAAVADEWVAASRQAKGWTRVPHAEAEEWGSGPLPVARLLQLCGQHHRQLARGRAPAPRRRRGSADGTTGLDVLPAAGLGDALLLRGHRARLVLASPAPATPPPRHGDVAAVLGAGNVTATPLLDTIDQVLLRGRAVVLKVSPLHTTLQPLFARAFAPLVEAGLLHVVAGDAALGAKLAAHDGIAAVHLTGSVATAAALRADPRLAGKELTAELGCCTPAFVLPGPWRDGELRHVAAQAAAYAAWNGGATCVAPRVLLTARDWPQREPFLHHVRTALAALPARVPFHAAARRDFAAATGGEPRDERLPPTLRAGLDMVHETALLRREHFAPVLLEVPLPGASLPAWLDTATAFVQEHVFGALSAYVWVPPRVRSTHRRELDAALRRLPHGTIAINTWTGLGFGLGTPWGVPAQAPWQHGIGWARDLWRQPLQRVVLEAPFHPWPQPPWLPGRRGAAAALRALTRHYCAPSSLRLAAVACHACR